jgi:hypothetical protein
VTESNINTLFVCITILLGLIILGSIVGMISDKVTAHDDKIYGRK